MGSVKLRPDGRDPYVYEGTTVLINLRGIRDPARAEEAERFYSAARVAELGASPVRGDFGLEHFCEIHRRIFQDSYAWAGEPRVGNISKDGESFADHDKIDTWGRAMLANLAAERPTWGMPGHADVPDRLANVMAELNYLHPFREGNGRSTRAFIGQLAAAHGLAIPWDDINKEDLLYVTRESKMGTHKALAVLLRQHAVPLPAKHEEAVQAEGPARKMPKRGMKP